MKQLSTLGHRTFLFSALFVLSTIVHAQKQTNFWYFGTFAGLNFNSGSPVVVTTGSLNTTEGCAAISDANGALLFYTDGVTVWNKNNTVMPNGTGLQGDPSSTQSALVVKKPGSSTIYYIFTMPAEGVGNFAYSVVDMTLDSGNGDVTTKNTAIKSNVTEKLSAVHNCNGTDIWVMVHELGNNSFYAYSVTSAGVSTTAVVSNVGRVQTRVYGQMKFNTAGTKLACTRDTMVQQGPPYQGTTYLDVFDFDNQTGMVTNPLALFLNNWQKSYGVEFSPDNSKVYASYYDQSGINGGNSEIIQYNLTATNVAASGVTVGASFDPDILRAMQLAPDGKIYVSKSGTPFLCVINSPNASGPASSYSADVINVDPNAVGASCMLGLPGFVQSYFNPNFPNIVTCSNTTTGILTESKSGGPAKVWFSQSDKLNISPRFDETGNYSFKVYNMLGKNVYENSFYYDGKSSEPVEYNLNALPSGVYMIDVSGKGISYRTKLYKP
jgi:hypothetical protein